MKWFKKYFSNVMFRVGLFFGRLGHKLLLLSSTRRKPASTRKPDFHIPVSFMNDGLVIPESNSSELTLQRSVVNGLAVPTRYSVYKKFLERKLAHADEISDKDREQLQESLKELEGQELCFTGPVIDGEDVKIKTSKFKVDNGSIVGCDA